MNVKDFKKLMVENMNEALIRMAEGMGSDGAAMAEIVAALDSLKLDGTRATGVLTALAQNTETAPAGDSQSSLRRGNLMPPGVQHHEHHDRSHDGKTPEANRRGGRRPRKIPRPRLPRGPMGQSRTHPNNAHPR
ncbi:MAG: hypothetical protein V8Q54_07175 [Alistipes senegalensis]